MGGQHNVCEILVVLKILNHTTFSEKSEHYITRKLIRGTFYSM